MTRRAFACRVLLFAGKCDKMNLPKGSMKGGAYMRIKKKWIVIAVVLLILLLNVSIAGRPE